jgi:hypothetical protein
LASPQALVEQAAVSVASFYAPRLAHHVGLNFERSRSAQAQ